MFRATQTPKSLLLILIIMTIIETTLQHQSQLQQHQNNRTTSNNYHQIHHSIINNITRKNHGTIHHNSNNNKDNLNQGIDYHYSIITNNNHRDQHNTSNSECRPHNSCIKCLSEENAQCFWCAETKQCDTYSWHRDFLEPAHCSFNEWHYNHCYVQEILFVIVITVLTLLLLISICLFAFFCHKARRFNQQRGHDGGSDTDGHDIELLDDGTFSSKSSSSSYGNCRKMYGKLV